MIVYMFLFIGGQRVQREEEEKKMEIKFIFATLAPPAVRSHMRIAVPQEGSFPVSHPLSGTTVPFTPAPLEFGGERFEVERILSFCFCFNARLH